jgi:hypothetical protein
VRFRKCCLGLGQLVLRCGCLFRPGRLVAVLPVKAPKPQPPSNLPARTVQIGGAIDWFSISLGIKGPDLIPDEITALLGRAPDHAQQKGKPLYREDGSLMRMPTFGAWWAKLKRAQTDEWDCAAAIDDLLATMPREREIWLRIASRFDVALRVGLSMPFSGAGFELPPELMVYLGERQIVAGFDVYSGANDPTTADQKG